MEPLIFFILLFLLIGLCFDCAPQNQPDQDDDPAAQPVG